jgi:hypothetical protein
MTTKFIVTGPSLEARIRFEKLLRGMFYFSDDELDTVSSSSLTSTSGDTLYFLVMPCSSRYNLWIENDESSMTNEIQMMCGGRPETTVEGGS